MSDPEEQVTLKVTVGERTSGLVTESGVVVEDVEIVDTCDWVEEPVADYCSREYNVNVREDNDE